jgi:hypothetical protein
MKSVPSGTPNVHSYETEKDTSVEVSDVLKEIGPIN